MTVPNPIYYNPAYAEAAQNIGKALLGDPEKAGEAAERRYRGGYYQAETAFDNAKTARQQMENDALQNGPLPADAPNSPQGWSAAVPGIMNAMMRAGIKEPSNYLSPVWGMQGEAQSGASPTEALTRAAYIGAGKPVNKDFAPTPERADDIANQEAQDKLTQALQVQDSRNAGDLAVQKERNLAPARGGRAQKSPVNYKTVQDAMLDALSGIPGATGRSKNDKSGMVGPLEIGDDARETLGQAGLYDKAEQAAGDALQASNGDENAARMAIVNALNLPKGAQLQYKNPAQAEYKGWTGTWPATAASGPYFADSSGKAIDLSKIAAVIAPSSAGVPSSPPEMQEPYSDENPPPPGPAAPPALAAPGVQVGPTGMPIMNGSGGGMPRANTREEALALPSGTSFLTPDGRIKVRP